MSTNETGEVERVRLPMICTCGLPGDEARRDEARALRQRAKDALSFGDNVCADDDFVTRALINLRWNWDADVEYAVDQWFGVWAKVEKLDPHESDTKLSDMTWSSVLTVACDCDHFEDGLAAIYLWFHENRPLEDE